MKLLQIPVFLCYVVGTLCLAVLVLVFAALNLFYRMKGWPDEEDATNCWSFAVPKFLKAGASRNYILMHTSEHVKWIPHVQFAPGPLTQYVEERKPRRPRRGWRGLMKVFWHKGRIRKGQGEE